MTQEIKKSNACGIIGLSTGWALPLVGIVLGIIALARREPNKTFGILAIILSVMFWIIWTAIFMSMWI